VREAYRRDQAVPGHSRREGAWVGRPPPPARRCGARIARGRRACREPRWTTARGAVCPLGEGGGLSFLRQSTTSVLPISISDNISRSHSSAPATRRSVIMFCPFTASSPQAPSSIERNKPEGNPPARSEFPPKTTRLLAERDAAYDYHPDVIGEIEQLRVKWDKLRLRNAGAERTSGATTASACRPSALSSLLCSNATKRR
jgi:hypothetical protein